MQAKSQRPVPAAGSQAHVDTHAHARTHARMHATHATHATHTQCHAQTEERHLNVRGPKLPELDTATDTIRTHRDRDRDERPETETGMVTDARTPLGVSGLEPNVI